MTVTSRWQPYPCGPALEITGMLAGPFTAIRYFAEERIGGLCGTGSGSGLRIKLRLTCKWETMNKV